jgi:MFS family permease
MNTLGLELNVYAVPAILTLALLVIETIFLLFFLPETRGKRLHSNGKETVDDASLKRTNQPSVEERMQLFATLRRFHFLFLCLFSGVEFTLTFLTFDCEPIPISPVVKMTHSRQSLVLDWNNKQNGMLMGSIGIISALLQGGYVRRSTSRIGEGVMARRGVSACAIGLVLLAFMPQFVSTNITIAMRLLQAAAVCMAFTSATVVNSLTAFASLQCDEGVFDKDTGKPMEAHPQLAKGKALGQFRSSGQLGRAIGPLLGTLNRYIAEPLI